MNIVTYHHTTETIDAVVNGQDINPRDSVLSICGSGDTTFAMAEIAQEVLSIDRSLAQVEYAKSRKKLIEADDFDGFLKALVNKDFIWAFDRRNSYFLEEERLQRIAEKVKAGKVSFEHRDFFEIASQNPGRFTKVYASCVFGNSGIHPKFYHVRLQDLSASLVIGGLIYLADSNDMNIRAQRKGLKVVIPEVLQMDGELTDVARAYEHQTWKPVVYRKIG